MSASAASTAATAGSGTSQPDGASASSGKAHHHQHHQHPHPGRQPMGQYLHPDYLEPAPSQTDPKQSPLALLVKTCDSIGRADIPIVNDSAGVPDSNKATAAAQRPHQRHSPQGRRPNCSSRPPSATAGALASITASAFDAPLKRPASPMICSAKEAALRAFGDDACIRPRPAKQRSPPSLQPAKPGSPPGQTTCVPAIPLSASSTAAAVAAAAAAAASAPPHHMGASQLPYHPMFPYHHPAQLAAAWGLGVPEGHTAAVCACPHCVHVRALVDYLYASSAAVAASAAAAAAAAATGPTAIAQPAPTTQMTAAPPAAPSAAPAPQTPQAEFCIFCGRHCPTPEQLVRHMRSHEAAANTATGASLPVSSGSAATAAAAVASIPSQLSPFSSPPPSLSSSSHHHATLAYAAAAAMQQQQQQLQQQQQQLQQQQLQQQQLQQQTPQQPLDSMRKWAAAAAAAAAADQRYHPYRSLLSRFPYAHFGATPLV